MFFSAVSSYDFDFCLLFPSYEVAPRQDSENDSSSGVSLIEPDAFVVQLSEDAS